MEEIEQLRAELVGVRAEAERLAGQLADREARTTELTTGIEALRRDLEAARGEAAQALTAATEDGKRLTARYREALLQAAPEVLPELIAGESVDDLDRALATAREVMARARTQVESRTAERVPAGSPVRSAADYNTLSPSEQIRAGIAERRT